MTIKPKILSDAIRAYIYWGPTTLNSVERLKENYPDLPDETIQQANAFAVRAAMENWVLGDKFMAGKINFKKLKKILQEKYPMLDAQAVSTLANRVAYDAGK